MISQEKTNIAMEEGEEYVVNYLLKNSNFFDVNSQLLGKLEIPHQSGAAVSLVERQVIQLRDKNRNLENHLRELVDVANNNQQLNEHMHALTLRLIGSQSIEELQKNLANSLKTHFKTDNLAFHFLKLDSFAGSGNTTLETRELMYIRESLGDKDILCGRLSAEQKENLFGGDIKSVESAALVWLNFGDDIGLMVLGSHDVQQFSAEKGTLFLQQLAELVSRQLTSLSKDA